MLKMLNAKLVATPTNNSNLKVYTLTVVHSPYEVDNAIAYGNV